MRTSRSPPAISRIRATNIRNFASGSRAWSRTTGGTPPSSGEDQLLRDAATLDGIPGILIQGRYDVSSPLDTAWQLSQRWRTSELHVLDHAGHGGREQPPEAPHLELPLTKSGQLRGFSPVPEGLV